MANIKGSHNGQSPYHRVIGKDWTFTDTNLEEIKPHAGNAPVNLISIAVCMAGNFVNDTPTAYQREQLKQTLNELMAKYSLKRDSIKLHREVRLKPTACPGKLDQNFISILLEPSMTCEQQLAEEKRAHQETLERERNNYTNWQTELDKRKALEIALAKEKSDHAETIKEKVSNYNNWQTELDRRKIAESRISKAKEALEQ